MPEISPSRRHRIPRSKDEWRARIHDALDRDAEHLPVPAGGRDLLHRVAVLGVVALMTASVLSIMALPGVAILGKTSRSLAADFTKPLDDQSLSDIEQRSSVVDRNGRVIEIFAKENRVFVPLKRIPEVAQRAIIATEDANFWNHSGVDLGGLVRALIVNVREGGITQGGSTLTQQLVKNNITERKERTRDSKIDELRRAVRLERSLSKPQILEAYLNETYFGNGVYGIGTAARYYFNKHAEKLGLAESALLAGIISAPETYNPLTHPERATKRRNLALRRMVDAGYISRAEEEKARALKLKVTRRSAAAPKSRGLAERNARWFVTEFIRNEILADERLGATEDEREAKLLGGGLRIETTLDVSLLQQAATAVEEVLDRDGDPPAALVAIEPSTGAIRAIIGSGDSGGKSYDVAVGGRRQPGSTFKTMALVAALDAGVAPSLTFDSPSPYETKDETGKPWTPTNYDKGSKGFVDLRRATELSINTYYAQLIEYIGPDKVVEVSHKLGIESELDPVLSLALGTLDVSPLELAGAYATLANAGSHCTPYAVAKITDASGKTLLRNESECEQRIAPDVAAAATEILRGVPLQGTGATNGQIGRPNAAKTGTTDDNTDAWYAGYTPQLATTVWIGFPESREKRLKIHGYDRGVTGGTLPAMIWSRFMRAAHQKLPVKQFPAPPSFAPVPVPDVRGMPLEEARSTLREAGFPTTLVGEARSGKPKGTVLSQSPAGGATADGGMLVRLTVSGGARPEPVSPSPSPEPAPSATSNAKPSAKPSPSPSPSKTKKP